MLTREQAVVALEIELEAAAVQPVDDVATLVGGDELVHDHLARRLDIGTVAADHAVETDSFELGRHLGLAAARAHISQVPIGAGGPDGRHAGRRNVALIVGDRAIDIKEQNFTGGHRAALSGLGGEARQQ